MSEMKTRSRARAGMIVTLVVLAVVAVLVVLYLLGDGTSSAPGGGY